MNESHEKKIGNFNNIQNANEDNTEMEHPDDLYLGLERIFQENGKMETLVPPSNLTWCLKVLSGWG